MELQLVSKRAATKICVAILFVCIEIIGSTTLLAQTSKSAESTSLSCVDKAEAEAELLKQQNKYVQEIEVLEKATQKCSLSEKLYTEISLKYLELGDSNYNESHRGDSKDKKEYFYSGLDWARKAIQADTTNNLGYEMVSTSYAAILSVSSLRSQSKLADSVRIYAEKALFFNPENDRAIHILGRWHYEVANLSWFTKFMAGLLFGNKPDGSIDKAIEYFKMSVALDDFPVYRYWLGKGYLEAGEKEKAIKEFEYLQSLPYAQKNDDYFKQEARKLIEKYK
tara:strand:- start:2756 stop:3598 length:843 start_codon:yes stop_codon:yes gene_type:complete